MGRRQEENMLQDWIYELEKAKQDLIDTRRYLHRHPELSFEEKHTPAFVAERLRSYAAYGTREWRCETPRIIDFIGFLRFFGSPKWT